MDEKPFFVYMLECEGGFIYTGVAIDPEEHFREKHMLGKGGRFTRINRPIRIMGRKRFPDRSTAMSEERRLKKLSPWKKRMWVFEEGGGEDPRE